MFYTQERPKEGEHAWKESQQLKNVMFSPLNPRHTKLLLFIEESERWTNKTEKPPLTEAKSGRRLPEKSDIHYLVLMSECTEHIEISGRVCSVALLLLIASWAIF